jgi:hypothetical protein
MDEKTRVNFINIDKNYDYCKNYDFVPLPLPSRYRPVTVPLPFLASVTHSPSPFHHRDTPVPNRP